MAWAAMAGHADVVLSLLRAGAVKDVTDQQGRTAMVHASENGHQEIVNTLS